MSAIPLAVPGPARAGWLVDRRHDLISTGGGLGVSLALVGLHV